MIIVIQSHYSSDTTGISHGPCYRRHQIAAQRARDSNGIAYKYQQNSRPIGRISHHKPLSLLKSTRLPTSISQWCRQAMLACELHAVSRLTRLLLTALRPAR